MNTKNFAMNTAVHQSVAHIGGLGAAVGAAWRGGSSHPMCPSKLCSQGLGSRVVGFPRCTRHPTGSLQARQNIRGVQQLTVLLQQCCFCLSTVPYYPPTWEAAEPQRPEPLSTPSVIQCSQGIAGVVQLAATDDPQVVQRNQIHWHMGYKYITLHLHNPLEKRWQRKKRHNVTSAKREEWEGEGAG